MRFIAELHQGGGCDYTIECGTKVIGLKATLDMQQARQEVEQLLRGDEDDPSPYPDLDSIMIYEVGETVKVDVRDIYARIAAARIAEAATARKIQDKTVRKALFEQLRKEFGEE